MSGQGATTEGGHFTVAESLVEQSDSAAGLTIVIPVFNEAEAVGDVLTGLQESLTGLGQPVEVLVVDDGSRDQTSQVVDAVEGVRLLRHRANRGYGAALKTGIRHASFRWILIMDADGTYPAGEVASLLGKYAEGEADMLVGARVGPDAAIPILRRPAKWAINRLASWVAGEAIPDVNSGMRLFPRAAALRFFDLLPDGFSFTTTLTLGMMRNGYLVEFAPIDYLERKGASKIRPVADTMGFIQLILRIALYFAPLRVFLPLGVGLVVLAVLWALFTGMVLGRVADASTAIIAMGGVQVAVVGLLAELINVRMPNRAGSDRRSDT